MSMLYNCLLCEEKNLMELQKYKKHHLVKCKKCSFIFSKKVPSKTELDKVYSNYNREHNNITLLSQEKIKNRAMQLINYKPLKTVLDLGCGNGHFLSCFKDLGIKTYGTEYDEHSASNAQKKGAQILNGGLMPEIPSDINSFDAIVFTEVIEHINNPLTILNHFKKILSPGGLLFITTPNFNSIERYILKDLWGMICYPEHISYYTADTLDYALTKVGFKKISLHTENISLYRIAEFYNNIIARKNLVKNTINPEALSAKAQNFTNKNINGRILKKSINFLLNATNSGSSLVGTYQKN